MSEIRVDKISGKTSANAVTVTGENGSTQTSLQQGLAKAGNNYNGTGTVAIRESFNVSSLTDNATAEQSSNLTNSMSNANYAGGGMSSGIAGTAYAKLSRSLFYSTTTSVFSTGTTYTSTGASIDIEFSLFAIQGDLA